MIVNAIIPPSNYAQKKVVPAKTEERREEDVIRVDTTLVTLPVSVKDRHGKVLKDLKQEQFRIYEDGIEQTIAYFEPPELSRDADQRLPRKPLTVALLLDVSDSTEFKLKHIKETALFFISLLRADDRVIVITFDKEVRVLAEATSSRDALHEVILRLKTGGGTSLYGALDLAINRCLSRVAGRKAILLLTDGVDTTSEGTTFNSTIRAAEASDVAIYPVQYNTYVDFSDNPSRETYSAGSLGGMTHVTRNGELASEAYKRGTLYLRLLADKTAGHFQYVDSTKNLARSFERVATELGEQYTLGYYSGNKDGPGGELRKIKVGVAVPKATVKTRKSYTYKPPADPKD
jgi:VWFA-related protein